MASARELSLKKKRQLNFKIEVSAPIPGKKETEGNGR
jgi:hypothetical protein